ncbi:unannotated protein [freshwater metagenome]|uniref:Unannotated protein n=1 Tax=freshwater metagenome TaxID=449393 RepID=A0A6J7BVH8_9ZZZZ|nr:helix-turn-helix domain-containing protein [Actinomycetota bacterium]
MQADRLGRAFLALELLAEAPHGLTISEVSRTLDLPMSSTHDLLLALAQLRLVDVSESRYKIGPKATALSVKILDGLEIRSAARSHILRLMLTIQEDVYLAVPSGNQLMYVDRYIGERGVSVRIRLGERLRLHSTAVGKLFAAYDDRFRRQLLEGSRAKLTPTTITKKSDLLRELDNIWKNHFSVSHGESFTGVKGIAVPVWGVGQQLVAAVHVSSLESLVDEPRLNELVVEMNSTAAQITHDLGGSLPDLSDGWSHAPQLARR